MPTNKYEYRYSENGDLTLLKGFQWDVQKSGWIPWSREVRSYDILGIERLRFRFSWNKSSNDWEKSSKDSIAYEEENSMIYYYFEWDEVINRWLLLRKIVRQLNDKGQLISLAEYSMDTITHEWLGCCKNEVVLDAHGYEIRFNQFVWDDLTSDWIIWGKYETSYFKNGKIKENISLLWDNDQGEWNYWTEELHTYEGNELEIVNSFEWDTIRQDWVLTYIRENHYDERGNIIDYEFHYYIDPNSELGDMDFKRRYFYNEDGIILAEDFYLWDSELNDWFINMKVFYDYYDPVITSLNELADEEITVYPNPANSYIYFSGPATSGIIQIYSIQGKLVKEVSCVNQILDISGLLPGLYIIRTDLGDGEIFRRKVIKK